MTCRYGNPSFTRRRPFRLPSPETPPPCPAVSSSSISRLLSGSAGGGSLLARGWTLPGEIEANSGNTTLFAAAPLAPAGAAGFFSALADLLCFGAGADPTPALLATLEAARTIRFVGFATRLEALAFF